MGRPKAQYNEQGQKQCVRCHEFKDVAAYPKSSRQWDGYEPRLYEAAAYVGRG